MILPTKGIPASRALITIGGEVLEILGDSSLSVSGLWLQYGDRRSASETSRISYDWFVLALDLLFILGAVQITALGLVRRVEA